ncbi:hypothetical protein Fmac_021732 [Flemingia macrophylla]|uniref:Transmembrane protein n=1 Tax=Flemingia macrophylla TaxID=520843 RepID=A0ABD1LXP8_9FABA
MDPSPQDVPDKKSPQLLSDFLGKKGDDDDNPFLDENLPDKFKNTHFSFWSLLECFTLAFIIALLVATLCISPLKNKDLWWLRLWKWEVMVLILIYGSFAFDWVIKIIVFCIERNFLL